MDRIETKFAAEGLDSKTGEFAGYGAVFGNVDTHGDVIEHGAFANSIREWTERKSMPIMKMMHGSVANPFGGSDLPIGKWRVMREDDRGLYMEGKLSGMNTDRGKFHYSLMEDDALNGLSIGYKSRKSARGDGMKIKRRLQDVKLVEVSLVPEGSNSESVVTQFKAWTNGDMPSLPEFEKFLREVGKFSRTEAKAIAGNGLSHLLQREAGDAPDELAEFYRHLTA